MRAAGLLDTVLDRAVLGYTNFGYRVRARSWVRGDLDSMEGRVVLVTGATAGIGRATAEGFALLGASVRMLVRDARRGELTRAEIVERTGNSDVEVELCDLSRLAAVRDFAGDFRARNGRLHVLVNNAGVLTRQRMLSHDGIELTFAVNVLAPFLLTKELLPALEDGAPSRVINVSSGGMYTQRLHAEDLQTAEGRFDGAAAYARTKRAEVILTELWAERLREEAIVVHAMHPGWVDTPGLATSLPRFHGLMSPLLRSAEQGADTAVWLGSARLPARSSGGFWHDRRARPTHRGPLRNESDEDRARLWEECERLLAGAGIGAAGRGAVSRG